MPRRSKRQLASAKSLKAAREKRLQLMVNYNNSVQNNSSSDSETNDLNERHNIDSSLSLASAMATSNNARIEEASVPVYRINNRRDHVSLSTDNNMASMSVCDENEISSKPNIPNYKINRTVNVATKNSNSGSPNVEIPNYKINRTVNDVRTTNINQGPSSRKKRESKTRIRVRNSKYCMNCCRCDTDPSGRKCMGIHLNHVLNIDLPKYEKGIIRVRRNQRRYTLCDECLELISMKMKGEKYIPWSVGWPAFMWHSFNLKENEDLGMYMWQYLPCTWRKAWLTRYREIGSTFKDVEENKPLPFFKDITQDNIRFHEHISSYKARTLGDILNEWCVPTVRCPWGCTEYIENCGYLPYGKFLFYCRPFKFPVVEEHFSFCKGNEHYEKVNGFVGMRPDFLKMKDYILGNKEWEIKPSIQVLPNGGAMLCTCHLHKNGSGVRYFHVPSNPCTGNQTSSACNNLAPAVLIPRTFKNMKMNNFSDSYQMASIGGGYAGIDSCNITSNRRFDRGNKLSFENELLSVYGREDIKQKLDSLVREREIPVSDRNIILHEIKKRKMNCDSKLLSENIGSTNVSMKHACDFSIATEEELVANSEGFSCPWPTRIIHCDNKGSDSECGPAYITGFSHGKQENKLLWIMLSITSRVSEIWNAMHQECIRQHKINSNHPLWCGWILKYATQNIITYMTYKRKKKSVYNKNINADKLRFILYNPGCLSLPSDDELHNSFHYNFSLDHVISLLMGMQTVGVCDSRIFYNDSEFQFLQNTSVIVTSCITKDKKPIDIYCPLEIDVPLHSEKNDDEECCTIEKFELCFILEEKCTTNMDIFTGYSDFHVIDETNCEAWASSIKEKNKRVTFMVSENKKIFIPACTLLIYRKKNIDGEEIRKKYMNMLGNECIYRCPVHDCYMVSSIKETKRYCKYKVNGEKCEREAKYKCSAYNECRHICCDEHSTEECVQHGKNTIYEEYRKFQSCQYVDRGQECHCPSEYECPEFNCNYRVCKKHKDMKQTNMDDSCASQESDDGMTVNSTTKDEDSLDYFMDIESISDSEANSESKINNEVLEVRNDNRSLSSEEDTLLDFDDGMGVYDMSQDVIEDEIQEETEYRNYVQFYDNDETFYENDFINYDIPGVFNNIQNNDEHFNYRSDVSSLNDFNRDNDIPKNVDIMFVDDQLESSAWDQLPPGLGLESMFNYRWSRNNEEPLEVDVDNNRVEVMENKNNYFSLHALFNKHLSLLIRTKGILKPTRKEQSFLQRIISSAKNKSVPLLYPEGMLFPSIFWKGNNDGSIEGSIPAGLWNSQAHCHKYGFASIQEHMRCRLMNASLPTSCNPEYMFFAFDAVNNAMSRGMDSRFIFRRGFEHMMGESSVHKSRSEDSIVTDAIDSRRTVNQLSSMIREEEPTYFITHTCNQREHFGVSPIREWLEKKCDDIKCNPNTPEIDRQCYIKTLRESAVGIITRGWLRCGEYYMDYVIKSDQEPLGPVHKYWWRWEYQEANGNVPHIHGILWTGENKNGDSLRKIQRRIGGSTLVYNDPEVISELRACNILKTDDEIEVQKLKDDCLKIQRHSCELCNFRCHVRKGPNDNELQCRYKDYYKISNQPTRYMYFPCNPNHSDEALQVLELCDLIHVKKGRKIEYLEPKLKGGIYTYPAEPNEHLSPFNPFLFAWVRCSTNVQICDTYLCSRYLAKYVQGIDDNLKVELKSPKHGKGAILVEQNVHNTKISSGFYNEKIREKKRGGDKNNIGRAIGLPEVMSLTLKVAQVHTNAEFIHMPSCSLEFRSGLEITEPCTKRCIIKDFHKLPQQIEAAASERNEGLETPCQFVREQREFSVERQFTWLQQQIMRDYLLSPYKLDNLTMFSIRPPELSFIKNPNRYMQYFTHSAAIKNCTNSKKFVENNLSKNMYRCMWINGANQQVKIREEAIKYILEMNECRGTIRKILEYLQIICDGKALNFDIDEEENSTRVCNIQELEDINSAESFTCNGSVQNSELEETTSIDSDMINNSLGSDSSECNTNSTFGNIENLEEINSVQNFTPNGSIQTSELRENNSIGSESLKYMDTLNWNDEDSEHDHCDWEKQDYDDILDCFVAKTRILNKRGKHLPIIVNQVAKPSSQTKFLLHIALSMGEFDNEAVLYSGAGSSQQLLQNANLLKTEDPSMTDVLTLTRRYILEQLLFLPKGTYLFDSYVVQSFKAFKMMVLEDVSSPFLSPAYLYSSLVQNASEEIKNYVDSCKDKLCENLSIKSGVPSKEVLLKCSKENTHSWQPNTDGIENQSDESIQEHEWVNKFLCQQVDTYIDSKRIPRTATAIVGGPGVGKTYEMEIACVYAICKGLSCMITASTSDRANMLGGYHVHKLLGIPRCRLKNLYHIAEKAIIQLQRHPEQIYLLRTLDVLCIDELGNLSAELLSIMNIVMQTIRCDPSYMGGVLIISSIDPKQLPPVEGMPALLSASVLVSFNFLMLKHSVRAISDPILRELIDIARKDNLTSENVERFAYIIEHHCSHVDSWLSDKIPQDAVRVLGKHKGMKVAEEIYFDQIKASGKILVTKIAEDFQASAVMHDNWKPANQECTNVLNKEVKEVQRLIMHDGLVVQMTMNHASGLFSNTQMGYILHAPSQNELNYWNPLQLYLAPSGIRNLPCKEPAEDILLQHGWKKISVHPYTTSYPIKVKGNIRARRKQYPIKGCIAITIHSAMGSEYGTVVSCVVESDYNEFQLWQKEQVLVLSSRTKEIIYLIFVGNPKETAEALKKLLLYKSPHQDYMNYIVNHLSYVQKNNERVQVSPVIYHRTNLRAIPINTDIPETNMNGFVYCLLSITNYQTTYIGSTINLMQRLYQHRCGLGARNTCDINNHQWHYLCYVSGFTSREQCYAFEKLWQQHNRKPMHPMQVQQKGEFLMQQFSKDLRMHRCLEFKICS